MPELPEVETVVRQLGRVLPGKVIEKISLRRLSSQLVGETIKSVGRKQKIIVITLCRQDDISLTKGEPQDLVLLVHLKMTGQLILVPGNNSLPPTKVGGLSLNKGEKLERRIVGGHPTADWVGELPSKHTRVTIEFEDGAKLFFNDQRKFGWMKVVPGAWWLVHSGEMAPDVVDEGFTVDYLAKVLSRSARAVKLVILDQDKIGGMGNIYACDALNLARINPKRPANQLKPDAVKRLHQAMIQVINQGIAAGGASYSHFVGIEGIGGHYQEQFLVYDREGEACKNCGGIIEKMKLGGRGTYFCPKCQR